LLWSLLIFYLATASKKLIDIDDILHEAPLILNIRLQLWRLLAIKVQFGGHLGLLVQLQGHVHI